MSGKKSRKPESDSDSEEEEDDKPKLLSVPKLNPPKSSKPAAAASAPKAPPVQAPAPAPAPGSASAPTPAPAPAGDTTSEGLYYTWKKALELAKPQLEELYGRPSAENPLPYQIRNIFGDILCPNKAGQDFYMPAELINLDNVKHYYELTVSKLPDSDLNGKAVKSWYLACTKRGLVKCFQETMPLMQQEINIVMGLLHQETEARRASVLQQDTVAPGSKRKGGAESEEEDVKRHREETVPRVQTFSSLSEFRRSYYSRMPIPSAKANHHDVSDGYDITALMASSQGAADVGAIRKIEVSSYRNRALPF